MPLDKVYCKEPLLSIIMPVYNCEKYVSHAIQSVIDQTYRNWELFVCDDGSSDESWNKIKSYCVKDVRIHIYRNNENIGKVGTVNWLFQKCSGKYLTVHDADDWSEKDRFEKQIHYLSINDNVIACGTNFNSHFDFKSQVIKSSLKSDYDTIKEGLLKQSQIHGPTLVLRQCLISKKGMLYRPFFEGYNEDYDLCVRLASQGVITNLNECLYNYRIVPNTLSRTLTIKKRYSIEIVRLLAKQRFQYGFDDLDLNQFDRIEAIVKEYEIIYLSDKSRLLREQAEYDFYYGFTLKAIKEALRAIVVNPFELKNFLLLQHIIRKKTIGI